MSGDAGHIPPPIHKIVNLGIIDNWLRGVAAMAPQPAAAAMPEPPATAPDFNMHMLEYDGWENITRAEMEGLVGCRQLLLACSRNDVRVDLVDHGQGRLKVVFNPRAPFSRSRIFGHSYTDSLPAFLGVASG